MFDNEYFEKWLDEKCAEILKRIQSEKLSTEDMVLLCLKAQTNHFHHMDIEFRDEFKSVRDEFKSVRDEFKTIRYDINLFKEEVNQRFERQNKVMMWGFAMFITTQMAILFK